jgi:hypothetical protein
VPFLENMYMKNTTLIILILIFTLGCENSINTPKSILVKKIHHYTEYPAKPQYNYLGATASFTYNSNGRIIKAIVEHFGGTGFTESYEYQYLDGQVSQLIEYYNDGLQRGLTNYTYDDLGQVIKTEYFDGLNTHITIFSYQIDGDKRMVFKNGNHSETQTIINGNIVRSEDTRIGSAPIEYNFDGRINFLGKSSVKMDDKLIYTEPYFFNKNNVIKKTDYYEEGNPYGHTFSTELIYTYDSEDRVINIVAITTATGDLAIGVLRFEY